VGVSEDEGPEELSTDCLRYLFDILNFILEAVQNMCYYPGFRAIMKDR